MGGVWYGMVEEGREGGRDQPRRRRLLYLVQDNSIVDEVACAWISTYHANSRSCSVAAAASDLQAERRASGSSEQYARRWYAMRCDAMHTAMHCE